MSKALIFWSGSLDERVKNGLRHDRDNVDLYINLLDRIYRYYDLTRKGNVHEEADMALQDEV